MDTPVDTPVVVNEAKPPIEEKMRDELARLSVPVLMNWLTKYGFVAKEDTPKKDLIEAIMNLHAAELAESDKVSREAAAALVGDDDPEVEMTFTNVECPNAPIEFTYSGPKGFKKGPTGKVLPAPKWKFYHGRTYKVPLSVVDHLNALKVPADVQVQTDAQGFIQSLYSGDASRTNRFSCQIKLSEEQRRTILSKGVKQ